MLDLPHGGIYTGGTIRPRRESHRNGGQAFLGKSDVVKFKKEATGPGQVIDRRAGGGATGPACARSGSGRCRWRHHRLAPHFAGGGGDLSGLTEVLQPAGGVQPETGNTLDPSVDPETDGCLPRGGFAGHSGDVGGRLRGVGLEYRPTNLVLFNGFTQSEVVGAGTVRASLLPDRRVRLHGPRLLAELQRRFGAAGDTAQAYILAHEVGHHVQHQLGITEQVQSAGTNEASVALEPRPTASGVRLSTLKSESAALLESGDLEEALNAAAAVGDDAIQQQTTGQVNPETWTHGSSEQRYQWLNQGFTSGSPSSCDTFAGAT